MILPNKVIKIVYKKLNGILKIILNTTLDLKITTGLTYLFLLPFILKLLIIRYGTIYLCLWIYLEFKYRKCSLELLDMIALVLFPILYKNNTRDILHLETGLNTYLYGLSVILFCYNILESLYYNHVSIYDLYSYIDHKTEIYSSYLIFKWFVNETLSKKYNNERNATNYIILFDTDYNITFLDLNDYSLGVKSVKFSRSNFVALYDCKVDKYKEYYTLNGGSVFVPVHKFTSIIEFVTQLNGSYFFKDNIKVKRIVSLLHIPYTVRIMIPGTIYPQKSYTMVQNANKELNTVIPISESHNNNVAQVVFKRAFTKYIFTNNSITIDTFNSHYPILKAYERKLDIKLRKEKLRLQKLITKPKVVLQDNYELTI